MFTPEHFIWIGLCAAFIAVMTVLSIKKNFSLKTAGYIMTAICAVSEISKIMSDMEPSSTMGMHLDPKSLPFHLCSLMIFAVLYITFGKEGRAKGHIINFLSVMGALGSFFAILIPTNGTDFTSLPAYQCFVYHAGLLWFALYLVISGRAKLGTAKSLAINIGLLLICTVSMLYINGMLSAYDTNFFYLTRPPMENLPYLNLSHGWYAYFLRLAALGAVLIVLFHLPFIIRHRRAAHSKTR